MDGLSLHHYTVVGDWTNKGSATDFSEDEYYTALFNALKMEESVTKHSEIMNKYDSQKRVGLVVDEWGTWYDVESGTNPGFLYQQNTMRDALVAAVNLNIFQKHCDRVKMANIAQIVNDLQSMILTEGAKIVLTPTYHVFDMMKNHQDATLLDSFIQTEQIGLSEKEIPNLHESVSLSQNGQINITIANLSLNKSYPIETQLVGIQSVKLTNASLLCGNMDVYNDFENPDKLKPKQFDTIEISGNTLKFTIPSCTVLQITLS